MVKKWQNFHGPNAFNACLKRGKKLDNPLNAIPDINLGLEDKPDYRAKA